MIVADERKMLKDASLNPAGQLEAVFATFDVVDLDGDVILKSAIRDGAQVTISGWNHSAWNAGALPVGHGRIKTTGTEARVEAQFFLDTSHGLDTWKTVDELSKVGLQQWSWSLRNIKSSKRSDGARVIESVDITEVSPVLLGASIGSRTLGTKTEAEVLEEGRRHADEYATAKARERAELDRIYLQFLHSCFLEQVERARPHMAGVR